MRADRKLYWITFVMLVAVLAVSALVWDEAVARLPESWGDLQDCQVQSEWDGLLDGIDPLMPNAWFQMTDDKTIIVAVGTATVGFGQNKTQAESNALTGAETTARMAMAELLYGVEMSSTVEIRERTGIRTTNSETIVEDLFKTESVTTAVADGMSRGAVVVGRWLSADRATAGVLLVADRQVIEEARQWLHDVTENDSEVDHTRDGVQIVRVKGTGSTVSEARDNALQQAVRIISGVIVSRRTLVVDTETILSRVRSFSAGYVQDYSVISGPECSQSSCWLEVEAWVSEEALDADIGRLNKLMGNPVMVVIEVPDSADHDPLHGSGVVQWLEESLLELGFTPHSVDAGSLFRRSTQDDAEIAAQMRTNHPQVDMVLLVSTNIDSEGGQDVQIARARVRLRVLDARTGELLGAVTSSGVGRSLSSETAAVDGALKDSSGEAASSFARQIAARWERSVTDGYTYLVRVHNISGGQQGAAQIDALRNALELSPGERSVEERHLTAGILELDVVHDGMIGEVREAIMSMARVSNELSNLSVMSMGGSVIELSIGQ